MKARCPPHEGYHVAFRCKDRWLHRADTASVADRRCAVLRIACVNAPISCRSRDGRVQSFDPVRPGLGPWPDRPQTPIEKLLVARSAGCGSRMAATRSRLQSWPRRPSAPRRRQSTPWCGDLRADNGWPRRRIGGGPACVFAASPHRRFTANAYPQAHAGKGGCQRLAARSLRWSLPLLVARRAAGRFPALQQ